MPEEAKCPICGSAGVQLVRRYLPAGATTVGSLSELPGPNDKVTVVHVDGRVCLFNGGAPQHAEMR